MEVCVGEYWFKSGSPVVRAGQATFLAEADSGAVAPGVLLPKSGDLRRFELPGALPGPAPRCRSQCRTMSLWGVSIELRAFFRRADCPILVAAAEQSQLPDVIVYLCEGGTRSGFLRFKSSALITRGFDLAPSWHKLHPVKPIGSVGPKTPPLPSLLLSVSLGVRAAAPSWPPMPPLLPTRTVMRPYELRLHLCMGRDLPAKDDVTLAGTESRGPEIRISACSLFLGLGGSESTASVR